MKKILYGFLTIAVFSLTACLTGNTVTTINDNGSGSTVSVLDMSGIFDMMEQMGRDISTEPGMEKAIDSTILISSMIDEIEKKKGRKLEKDEKEFYSNSSMHVKMNAAQRVMTVTLNSKFTKLSQLEYITELNEAAMEEMPFGDSDNDSEAGGPEDDMNKVDEKRKEAFRFTTKDGLIEYAFDEAKYNLSEEEQQMIDMMDQLAPLMEGAVMTTVYNLPRPAKHVSAASKYSVSDDKKQVTITYNYLDLIQHPEKITYKIEY